MVSSRETKCLTAQNYDVLAGVGALQQRTQRQREAVCCSRAAAVPRESVASRARLREGSGAQRRKMVATANRCGCYNAKANAAMRSF